MKIAFPIAAASILVGSMPVWAGATCGEYESLRNLPGSFKEAGHGHLPRRNDEVGTPGLDDLMMFSDARCDCSNTPVIERDRGRSVPAGKFWDCVIAQAGERAIVDEMKSSNSESAAPMRQEKKFAERCDAIAQSEYIGPKCKKTYIDQGYKLEMWAWGELVSHPMKYEVLVKGEDRLLCWGAQQGHVPDGLDGVLSRCSVLHQVQ